MTGRAGHAEEAEIHIAVDHETDRQTFWIQFRLFIGKIAVTCELISAERLIHVEATQRLEPEIGYHVRSLARGVECLSVVRRPALLGVLQRRCRTGLCERRAGEGDCRDGP